MSDQGFVVLGMVGSMALMVFGIIAARCWENVQHHKIEADKPAIDAELIEAEWTTDKPTEEGFYWFEGTIEYGPEKWDTQQCVFVVHQSEQITSLDITCVWEEDFDDKYEYKYTGRWTKLEMPK